MVGQIIPWNFPLLMACWKLAPALAAGNCVVLKPAEQTPASILVLLEVIGDLLPPGVLNVVNGFGLEAGKPLASNPRIAKIAFTGETTTGRLIMQYASQNLIPVTLELGGKSPNIFFADVMSEDDDFLDKAIEGFVLFAFNQGEVCTCPSRALIQESIYEPFMERALERIKAIKQGNPFDPATMLGAQASSEQLEKILSYLDIGRQEGAEVLIGGERAWLDRELAGGYYVKPTVFKGHNQMRIFQEEIFGPVVSVTTFKDEAGALAIANDTLYGLGAGLWSRDANRLYRMGRAIQAGRVWTNCYHAYPAHAAFGGYKQSGIGRENHKMMPITTSRPRTCWSAIRRRSSAFFETPHVEEDTMSETKQAVAVRESGEPLPPQVTATAAALQPIDQPRDRHGPVLFHQSGGCCDGSSPMCFPIGEFIVGDRDVLLGQIGGADFYINPAQFEYWKHTQLIIDVVPGRGGMFSLENGLGLRFLLRSRLFSDDEFVRLRTAGRV